MWHPDTRIQCAVAFVDAHTRSFSLAAPTSLSLLSLPLSLSPSLPPSLPLPLSLPPPQSPAAPDPECSFHLCLTAETETRAHAHRGRHAEERLVQVSVTSTHRSCSILRGDSACVRLEGLSCSDSHAESRITAPTHHHHLHHLHHSHHQQQQQQLWGARASHTLTALKLHSHLESCAVLTWALSFQEHVPGRGGEAARRHSVRGSGEKTSRSVHQQPGERRFWHQHWTYF